MYLTKSFAVKLFLSVLFISLFTFIAHKQMEVLAEETDAPITSTPITSAPGNTGGNNNNNNNLNQSSNSNNGGSNNGGSTITVRQCTDAVPSFQPVLFQINTTKTSATLYFTPVLDADGYSIIYGTKAGSEEHGVVFNDNSLGVKSYTITHLKPNTNYYFKVSANKGCASGPWSNWMKASTNLVKSVFYLFNK